MVRIIILLARLVYILCIIMMHTINVMTVIIEENMSQPTSNASCSSNTTEPDIDCSGILLSILGYILLMHHPQLLIIILLLYRVFQSKGCYRIHSYCLGQYNTHIFCTSSCIRGNTAGYFIVSGLLFLIMWDTNRLGSFWSSKGN